VKWDPARVALDMELLTSNGSYVFSNEECLSQGQIKSYFSRLAVKQRSVRQDFNQQTTSNITSSSSPSMSILNTSNAKSSGTTAIDESEDNDEVDHRDLEVYAWRQMLDEARDIIDRSSISSTTSNSSTATNASSKRKLITET
jgi:hypothetical protein